MDEEKNLTRREFVVRSGVVIGAGVLLSSPIGLLAADVNGSRVRTRGYAAFDTSGKLSPWSFERRAVGDNDILIETKYASICHSDIHQMKGHWGVQKYPQVPGHEIVGIVAAVGFVIWLIFFCARRIREHLKGRELDAMEGHDFEYFCADLLEDHGFKSVEVTRGSGDYGVDVLAEKEGVTYAVQCKRYDGPVGVKAVQEAYAGRDYYDRMVGAVMTNQYFTEPAVKAAKKLKILLWDRGYLESMMEEEE